MFRRRKVYEHFRNWASKAVLKLESTVSTLLSTMFTTKIRLLRTPATMQVLEKEVILYLFYCFEAMPMITVATCSVQNGQSSSRSLVSDGKSMNPVY